MNELKLIALDNEDLEVLSAHLQDAVVRVEDMAYLPGGKRFAAIFNRFNWEKVHSSKNKPSKKYERRRSALRIERVLGAKLLNINPNDKEKVFKLLAIQYEAIEEPGAYLSLVFSGGGTIKLQVECIEIQLQDLGAAWETRNKPEHEDEISS